MTPLLAAGGAPLLSSSTPTSVVLSNVGYLVGLVVLAAIVITIVVVRHRRPVSVEANLDLFHRGLAALAPDSGPRGRRPVQHRAEVVDLQPRVRGVRGLPTRADGAVPPEPSTRSEPG